MALSPFVKPLGITAAILGILQGIIWSALSIMAILIHTEVWKPSLSESHEKHSQAISHALILFLTDDSVIPGSVLNPTSLHIWSITYLVTSIIWICSSTVILCVLSMESYRIILVAFFFNRFGFIILCLYHCSTLNEKIYVNKKGIPWMDYMEFICLCDLILTTLLGSDYTTIVEELDKASILQKGSYYYTSLACGILMTLTARGFVLWIVNLVFIHLLLKIWLDLPKEL